MEERELLQTVNACALHGKPLPNAVNAHTQILYKQLCILYKLLKMGADEKEIRALRVDCLNQWNANKLLVDSEMAIHKLEQERIICASRLICDFNKAESDAEKRTRRNAYRSGSRPEYSPRIG